MSALLMKKWASKAWLWLKTYWYIPLSMLAIAVSYVFFKERAESMMKAFMQNREGYKEQSKKIDEIHDKQISERNKHIVKKDKKVKKLEQEHQEKLEKIEEKKVVLVQDLKEKDLASELDKEFDL